MSITVNDNGVLRKLGAVTVNHGGVLRKLGAVTVNHGGVLREIMSKKLVWSGSTSYISETRYDGRYVKLTGNDLGANISTTITLKSWQTFSLSVQVLSISGGQWKYMSLGVKITSSSGVVYEQDQTGQGEHKVDVQLNAGTYTIQITDKNVYIYEWEVLIHEYN